MNLNISNNYLPSLESLGIKENNYSNKTSKISNSFNPLASKDQLNMVSDLLRKNSSQKPFQYNNKIVSNDNIAPSFSQIKNGLVLEKGDKGESVKQLQKKLTDLGFNVQNTGYFGDITESKLKEFQREYGITPTGKLGPTTLKVLENPIKSSVKIGIGKPTVLGNKIANSARRVASSRDTVGWCYAGVADAVSRVAGSFLYGESAYMAAPILAQNSKFKELKVKSSDLPKLSAGSIVVWGKSPASPHGHISVALGNGKEASDHIANQLTSLRGYKNFRVFVPVA